MVAKLPFVFDRVAIFGRSLDEYVRMFNLDLVKLRGKRILDCGAGPAAFTCQAAALGLDVVACDPIYQLDPVALRDQIDKDAENVIRLHASHSNYFYPKVTTVAERRQAMEIFFHDFASGKPAGRYVPGRLPELPFADRSFDLTLSSNFLFIYSDKESGGMMDQPKFDYQFHLAAISELVRVSQEEVRIYPLQGPEVNCHKYLNSLIKEFQNQGYLVELMPVKQRDIIGAEQLLRIARQ